MVRDELGKKDNTGMSTNRTIRGLSGRGFRVYNSSGALKVCNENTSVVVNVDDLKTQLILSREKDNFIRTAEAGTFTVTVASPGVFTKNGHGFSAGDAVVLSTTGALPTGLTAGTKYYVISAGLATNTFRLSATRGGSAINTTGTQSGTHTVTPISASIVGLSRRGFRINAIDGTVQNVSVDNSPVVVDLTSGAVRRVLKRSWGKYVFSTSATLVTLRGLLAEQQGFDLKDNGTVTLTSDNTNVSASDTVVISDKTYTFKSALTEVKATAVLTSDNTNVADGDTATINDKTYRFKNTPAQANDVKIGADANTTLANLVKAVNLSGVGDGTDYYAGTTAPTGVTAGAVNTGAHTVTFTATTPGTAANSFASTETSAHLSFGGATFSGGVNPVAYEVLIGASADASLTNLAAAINGTTGAGTTYATGTPASTYVTSGAVASHAITLSAIAGTPSNVTVSTTATHLTFNYPNVTDGLSTIYRSAQAAVDPSDPAVFPQLRRHFKAYIEV